MCPLGVADLFIALGFVCTGQLTFLYFQLGQMLIYKRHALIWSYYNTGVGGKWLTFRTVNIIAGRSFERRVNVRGSETRKWRRFTRLFLRPDLFAGLLAARA